MIIIIGLFPKNGFTVLLYAKILFIYVLNDKIIVVFSFFLLPPFDKSSMQLNSILRCLDFISPFFSHTLYKSIFSAFSHFALALDNDDKKGDYETDQR